MTETPLLCTKAIAPNRGRSARELSSTSLPIIREDNLYLQSVLTMPYANWNYFLVQSVLANNTINSTLIVTISDTTENIMLNQSPP